MLLLVRWHKDKGIPFQSTNIEWAHALQYFLSIHIQVTNKTRPYPMIVPVSIRSTRIPLRYPVSSQYPFPVHKTTVRCDLIQKMSQYPYPVHKSTGTVSSNCLIIHIQSKKSTVIISSNCLIIHIQSTSLPLSYPVIVSLSFFFIIHIQSTSLPLSYPVTVSLSILLSSHVLPWQSKLPLPAKPELARLRRAWR